MSKNVFNEEKANSVFAVKLRRLFEATGKTHSTLAQYIDEKLGESITRQAVGQWCNGVSCPNLRTVPIIAQFFDVSTDFLLTDTEIQTNKTDIKGACEYTGLSEKAVHNIRGIQRGFCSVYCYERSPLSAFIESDRFVDLLDAIYGYRLNSSVSSRVKHFIPALNKIVNSHFDYELKQAFIVMFSHFYDLDIRVLSLDEPCGRSESNDIIRELTLKNLPKSFVREQENRMILEEYKAGKELTAIMESLHCNESDFSEDFENLIGIFAQKKVNCKNIPDEFLDFVAGALKSCEEGD